MEKMGGYVSTIKKLGGDVSKFSTETDSKEISIYNYGKLVEKIKKYEEEYNKNLEDMKKVVENIKSDWQGNPNIQIANNLGDSLDKCKKLTSVAETDLTAVQEYITMLSQSDKLGPDHEKVIALNNGMTYLKTHMKYKKKSDEMAQSFLKKFSNKVKKAAQKVSNAQNKLNETAEKVSNAQNKLEKAATGIESFEKNPININILKSSVIPTNATN